LAAAIRSGFCSQRAKKTLASAFMRSPLLIRQRGYSISGVLQFCERYILEHRRKTAISAMMAEKFTQPTIARALFAAALTRLVGQPRFDRL
jgi:hypothetical protein